MITISNSQILGKRTNQEDYFASRPYKDGYICVLADGMGGYEGGEVASALSVKTFLDYFESNQSEVNIKKLFNDALDAANQAISTYAANHLDKQGMGTTFIALLVYKNKMIWVSVGDSIIYRYRNGVLDRINVDHSVAGELAQDLAMGKITQQEYDDAPNKHMLTSAMMGDPIPLIDIPQDYIAVETNDIIILATDGIHTLSDDEIARHIEITEYSDLAESITDTVTRKNRRNQDNTTLITIKVSESKKVEEIELDAPKSTGLSKIRLVIYLLVIILLGVALYLSEIFIEGPTVTQDIVIEDINETEKKEVKEVNSTSIPDINETVQTDLSRDLNITIQDINTSKIVLEVNSTENVSSQETETVDKKQEQPEKKMAPVSTSKEKDQILKKVESKVTKK